MRQGCDGCPPRATTGRSRDRTRACRLGGLSAALPRSGGRLRGMAEGDQRERALALVQAGEFTSVHVGIAGKGMLRARESSFLVWTTSKPEALRRAHAYCEARGWQIDWRCGWQIDLSRDLQIDRSRNRPAEQWGEALRVHPATRRDEPWARHCVMRGQHEPLPDE